MKFVNPFQGVPLGAVYPVSYVAGDDCPADLEAAAASVGAFDALDDDDASTDDDALDNAAQVAPETAATSVAKKPSKASRSK